MLEGSGDGQDVVAVAILDIGLFCVPRAPRVRYFIESLGAKLCANR